MSFLKAEWRKLAIVNYEVPKELLTSYLPAKTELDLWNGKCFVSLVGFKFVNTKILGLKIPFHVNFEEVNLRFYVKHFDNNQWKRGVVFIKEIVPKSAISIIANAIYHENYETLRMNHSWLDLDGKLKVAYEWKKQGTWQQFSVTGSKAHQPLVKNSETEFITEHFWGYTKVSESKTMEYEVRHPRWDIYPVVDYEIDIDFGLTYGESFAFLNNQMPASVMLAEGSEITVEKARTI